MRVILLAVKINLYQWQLMRSKSYYLRQHKEEKPRAKIEFHEGEKVRVKEGPFENYDGTVEEVLPAVAV